MIKSVTSVSGGKSSAYMAIHFPTDHYIFSCVLTDDRASAPKDPGLLRECQNRIPGFIASRELDQTLINLLRLKQELGQEVKWIAASTAQHKPGMMLDRTSWTPELLTFDRLIKYRGALPNRDQRWCTEQMKIYAIFWHVYLNIMEGETDLVQMNIGFRWDEGKRISDMANRCDKVEFPYQCPVNAKNSKQKHQWRKIDWRFTRFPMHEAKIDRLHVIKYWLDRGWSFPVVSNCDGCFHHSFEELHHQNDIHPERMNWWSQKEIDRKATWKNGISYEQILSKKQLDLFGYEAKSIGCFCTD